MVLWSLLILMNSFVLSLDNGLALTPPMGWNSWNYFGCNINETIVKKTADYLITSGLNKKGYIYVNIDDCWQLTRADNGTIQADSKKFPSGMKNISEYIHSLGLKFGLYSDAGYYTCEWRPGSLNFEERDAMTYAEWGVDFLKYDNCYTDSRTPIERYTLMRDALNKTGRSIVYSMCEWGLEKPFLWANAIANSWRTTPDIIDNWDSFISILDQQYGLEKYAGLGGWNDPDMLEVGNAGMTDDEYTAHFALWALLKAPLLLGFNVDTVSNKTLSIVSNEEIIKINQDPLGKQGRRVYRDNKPSGYIEIYLGEVNDGYVIVFFNRSNFTESITANLEQIGVRQCTYGMNNILTSEKYVLYSKEINRIVKSHSVDVIKLTTIKCTDRLFDFLMYEKYSFLK